MKKHVRQLLLTATFVCALVLCQGCNHTAPVQEERTVPEVSQAEEAEEAEDATPGDSYDNIDQSSQPEEEAAREIPSRDAAVFLAGPNGTEAVVLTAGDTFLGFTVNSLSANYYGDKLTWVRAEFSGMATLKGRLSLEEGIGSPIVTFTVAEESLDLLPYAICDTRKVWFGFFNEQAVRELVGEDPYGFDCEIVIDSYWFDSYPSTVWNNATLVELHMPEEA